MADEEKFEDLVNPEEPKKSKDEYLKLGEEFLDLGYQFINPWYAYLRSLKTQSWIKTIVLCLFLFEIGFLFWGGFTITSGPSASINSSKNISMNYVTRSSSLNKIAVVTIKGVITGDTAERIKNSVAVINKDSSIKAVILDIDSPGGSSHASIAIHDELMKIKSSSKPIVAYFNGLAASAAYHAGSTSDKIIISLGTFTGSIGVIMSTIDYSKTAEKVGVKFNVFKSGAKKDIFSPYRPVTEDERKIIGELINESYDDFVDDVAAGRKLKKAKVYKLADGRIYSAKQAIKNGLADEIGYFEDAVETAKKLANLKDASLVRVERRVAPIDKFLHKVSKITPLSKLDIPIHLREPGMYYLWIID